MSYNDKDNIIEGTLGLLLMLLILGLCGAFSTITTPSTAGAFTGQHKHCECPYCNCCGQLISSQP